MERQTWFGVIGSCLYRKRSENAASFSASDNVSDRYPYYSDSVTLADSGSVQAMHGAISGNVRL